MANWRMKHRGGPRGAARAERATREASELIRHAERMLEAERSRTASLSVRGRLILTAAPALIGTLGIGLTIAIRTAGSRRSQAQVPADATNAAGQFEVLHQLREIQDGVLAGLAGAHTSTHLDTAIWWLMLGLAWFAERLHTIALYGFALIGLICLLGGMAVISYAAVNYIRHREDAHGSVMRGLEGIIFDTRDQASPATARLHDYAGLPREVRTPMPTDPFDPGHQKHIPAQAFRQKTESDAETVEDAYDRFQKDSAEMILDCVYRGLMCLQPRDPDDVPPHADRLDTDPRQATIESRKGNFIWSLKRWHWTQPTLFSVSPLHLMDWFAMLEDRERDRQSSDRSLQQMRRSKLQSEREITEQALATIEARTAWSAASKFFSEHNGFFQEAKNTYAKVLEYSAPAVDGERLHERDNTRGIWKRTSDLRRSVYKPLTFAFYDLRRWMTREYSGSHRGRTDRRLTIAMEFFNAYHEIVRFPELQRRLLVQTKGGTSRVLNAEERKDLEAIFHVKIHEDGLPRLYPNDNALRGMMVALLHYVLCDSNGLIATPPKSCRAEAIRQIIDAARRHDIHDTRLAISPNFQLQFSELFCAEHIGLEIDGRYRPDANVFGADVHMPDRASDHKIAQHEPVLWRIFVSTYITAQEIRSQNFNLFVRIKRSEEMLARGVRSLLYSVIFAIFAIGLLILA